MIQRNFGELLKKVKNLVGPVSDKDRKVLIAQTHAYLSLKFDKVERKHMVQAAKLLVFMVPNLKDTSEGENAGFVCILNRLAILLQKNIFKIHFSF